MTVDEIRAQYAGFAHVVHVVQRSHAGRPDHRRLRRRRPSVITASAAQLWTMIHGFVMLELAGYFGGDGAAVGPVLGSMAAICLSPCGDSPERLVGSLTAAGWL